MDLDKLADLARRAYCLPDVDLLTWEEIEPSAREAWRAAADAVRMACETPLFDSVPALRERIIMQLAAHKRVDESDKVIIDRAKAFESYILGSDGA